MGDGGVACAPSQHAMERFPNTEAFCSGGSTGFSPKPFQKMRRSERDDGTENKQELCSGKGRKSESRGKRGELEKGEFMQERHRRGDLEPGELQNGELEKGEFVPDHKWRRDELEKGEFVLDKWSKYDVETGEIIPDKWSRRREEERSESGSGKGRKSELEKGEFILDSWRKGGRERERSPGDFHRRKDGSRSEQDRHTRHSSKWDGSSHERDTKNCSRVTEDEPGQYKYEHSNGKSHGKKHSSGTWPKWPLMELDSSGRKHREEFNDHSGLKSRRISEESNWSNHLEKGTRNVSSSAPRLSLTGRYSSSRHHQPSLPSRGCHDRPGRSPGQPERSPLERTRHYDHRDRSPDHSEQSSHDRARHHDHKDRTSSQSERSSHDRARHHDHRDRTPGHLERSPHDRSRASDHREQKRRGGGNEKQQNNRKEERLGRGNSSGKDANRNSLMKPSNNSSSCPDSSADDTHMKEKELQNLSQEPSEPPPPPPHPPPPPPPLPPQTLASGTVEEPPSMEEDMDICDTPPHVAIQVDMDLGKWYYLDHFGVERGPSKLADLKMLVEEGILLSDHLIKHSDSDRWVTVENAASPLVSLNLSSIVSDTVTQMVSPPEAPGNLLGDADVSHEAAISLVQQESRLDDSSVTLDSTEDYDIDERVGALLDGYTVIHGKELESIGEALNAHFVHTDLEKWGHTEDFTRSRPRAYDFSTHVRDVEGGGMFDGSSKEVSEVRLGASFDKENVFFNVDSSDWFDGRWSCMGGDWKRNDESTQDRLYKRRQVLNDGYPLCLMPKSGYEDPRWQRKDDLYHTSRIRKLDLPPWAFSWTEDKNESFNDTSKHMLASRSAQVKPLVPRVVKGTMLPVIRINACVVKDQGSFEPRVRMRSSERHTSKSSRSYSTSGDRNLLSEVSFRSKKPCDRDFQSLHKCRTILNTPKDHVCTVDELSLNLGDWYYLDGAGHEHGPLTYVELQDLAANGSILKNSSVFRKDDNIWLPITSNIRAFVSVHDQDEKVVLSVDSSLADCHSVAHNETSSASQSFHNSHPQFIGYARGKLHELVMKSYKNREFAAAINEVLDPWMSSNQPKKEMDRHFPFNSSITKSSAVLAHDLSADKFWKSEDNSRSGKRARLFFDESNGDSEMEEDIVSGQGYDCSFDDLCGEAASVEDNVGNLQAENESWGLLNVCVLARVFHFLRKDMKSLLFSAATCKQWKTAVNFYKSITNYVDLSSAGPSCTDSMFRCIMDSYDKKNITYVVLAGCSNITASLLEEVLCLCPSISSVDISGCSQFRELKTKCQNVKWLKGFDSSCTKTRSLKQITEKSYLLSKAFRGSSSHLDDSDEHVDSDNHELDLNRKDSSSHPFRQGYYKGKRLHDARKSSAALSRTTHMKQLVLRNQYKKMEEFIAISLKEIMRENTFDFFIPKVAQIEGKMRSGYYVRSGLGSIKEDIRRMCRDALKVRNRGDAGELNQIMMSFIQLLKSLDENPKLSNDRDEMIRSLKDDSDSGFNSSTSKYGKKLSKPLNEKRGMTRGNSTSYTNGGTDYGTFAFEREIRRRLSKLKRRNMDSESETSDDLSEDVKDEGGSTDSDTESDLDLHSGEGIGDVKETGYFMMDEALDSISADREWGARMTKASLAPPVTRKYEVIDRYLIIADEDEVQRKMQVALPDDYAEKLLVQRSGKEESDMELPEVKEYKPRKVLGEEVIEQEVYGIDPYTHNLLLDSMPEESEWPLVDKHKFIEEVLLRALNKQVQHFTGTGNTPMVYPVQPVIEKIQKTAEEDGDKRIVKMCMTILKAMQSRPVDNYVAYRKGLGVVCNKEEGFGEDDFVVEFLGEVYPVWKWFEKQDGIRSLQKNNQDPAPEFYNIYLERPKGDRDGYDLVVVDAMHKANYASRICHSCRPNCEAKVTAVDGHYQIGIYAVRPISYGEEITFDYNSVTESKEEYEASVCLCGSQVCRGSYLNLTGEGAFQKVLKDCHGLLDRHKLMLEACEANSVSQEDYIDLARAGLGTCLLSGLPDWLVAYSAHLVRFISFERTKLPDEILKHNLEEKRKFFSDICLEVEKSDAEVQAEGVYNARLQNMAVTLDKVRYVMRCVFGDAKRAPPPLQKLSPEAVLSVLWKGEGSLVEELLQCMAPHIEADLLNELKSKIRAHDPSDSDDLRREIKKSLLWLRDELRNLPCTFKCRHDAAADLIHLYAYTKCFYKVQEYKTVKSPPVYISPLDLGPKYADKMGSGFQEYCKMYGETYCLGQLIYWHCQAKADPDCTLARSSRGCLSLPDVSSFYARSQKLLREHVYSSRTLRFMLSRMEKQPQRPWPKDRIWVFKSSPKFFGSPMLDAVLNNCPLDKEMVHWLRSRPSMFHGA